MKHPYRIRRILTVGLAAIAVGAGAQSASAAVITLEPFCGPTAAQVTTACPAPWVNTRLYFQWIAKVDGVIPVTGLEAVPQPGAAPAFLARWCRGLNEPVPASQMREGNFLEICQVRYDDPATPPGDYQLFPPAVLASERLRLDTIAPNVVGAANRAPDVNGWYNAPITVNWTGSDPDSGVAAGCGSTPYSGPANANASVSGGVCTDRAGNTSTVPGTFTFKYDATPPTVDATATAGSSSILVQWTPSSDVTAINVTRVHSKSNGTPVPIYTGLLGNQVIDQGFVPDALYTYRISATDQAGNTFVRTVTASTGPGAPPPPPGTTTPPGPPLVTIVKSLMTPPSGAVLKAPTPKLRWPSVAGATYYNVQIHVRGRKVLSTWPTTTNFQVKAAWRVNGKRYELPRGVKIRWYVWPATGSVAKPKFGTLIGTSTFSVKKKR